MQFSDDQKIAYDKILELLSSSGVNVESKSLSPLYQKKNKELIGSVELIAFQNKWINKKNFQSLIRKLPKSEYKVNLESYL